MKLTVEEGILDLPVGLSLEIEQHNPFYSDAGTSSIPVSLPLSPGNVKLLGRPDNLCRSERYIRQVPAFLECGVVAKRALLTVDTCGQKGISVSLVLSDSEMYTRNQDRKLKEIFADRAYGMSKMNVSTPFEIFRGQFRSAPYLNDVAIFPVASDIKTDGSSTEVFIINQPTGSTIIDNPRTVTIGDSQVSVPAGYGISPYLYLWACVQYAFEDLGYEVRVNEIKTDFNLKEIVLLNDLADTCCPNYALPSGWGFQYADLVPDITLGEFIIWLRDKFGVVITCDSEVVEIRLFENCARKSVPDYDLTPFCTGTPDITYPSEQGLRLSVETSIEGAEPAAESLETLRSSYENCTQFNTYDEIKGVGLFYVKALGMYYYRDYSGNISKLGSDAYDYVRSQSAENEEVTPNDFFVPMVLAGGMYIPYIGERSHRYVNAGSPAEQSIKICYAHFLKGGLYSGSTNTCGYDGRPHMNTSDVPPYISKGYVSLNPEGIRKIWWGAYEDILLNGSPVVSAEFDMPLHLAISLDIAIPKRFCGVNILLKDMTYTVSDADMSHIRATMQVLPNYEDKVTVSEIFFGTAYHWRVESTRTIYDGNGISIIATDGVADYTAADAPTYAPGNVGLRAKVRRRYLIYQQKKWNMVNWQTCTHYYDEYFISEFGK